MNDKESDSGKQATDDLLETLRKAKALYEQQSRTGCLLALNGVIEFLRQTEEVAEQDLHVPLVVLAAALADLNDGTPTPLLTLSPYRFQCCLSCRPSLTARLETILLSLSHSPASHSHQADLETGFASAVMKLDSETVQRTALERLVPRSPLKTGRRRGSSWQSLAGGQ
mgnify:CR=1 FL=1